MQGNFHRVTIVIDTDDNKRFSEVCRLVVGLQGILAPDVELDYAVEPNEALIEAEAKAELDHNDEPF